MMSSRRCEGRWCEQVARYSVTSADRSQTKHFCEDHAVSFYRAIHDREWDSLSDMIRIRCADLESKTETQIRSADDYWRRQFLDTISGRSARWTSGTRRQPNRNERDGTPTDNALSDMIKRANEVLATRGRYLRYANGEWRLETMGVP